MRNKLFQEAQEQVPEHTHVFIKKYTDIVDRIYDLMEEKGYLQKDLANLLDKRESEISKWLKGDHNLTLRTIAKLEVALGEEIIGVPKRVEKDFISPKIKPGKLDSKQGVLEKKMETVIH